MPSTDPKLRVLFFAEAVTLAHVARPVTLARSLAADQFEAQLAWDDRYAKLFPDLPMTTHAIRSIPTAHFTAALAKGSPIYRIAELRDYVEQDLRIIRAVKPDVIVGDFRLSLAISAPTAGVPHIALANAYWSPYAKTTYPMPDHPITRLVGRGVGGLLFSLVRPLAFSRYAAPINRLRLEYGLPSLGGLRSVYTHGDFTAYADVPEMLPLPGLPDHHRFIGPVHWSPRTELPPWWDSLPASRPIVYVNLGSSGRASLLPAILESLAAVDVTVIAATAGGTAALPNPLQGGGFLSDFLPGDLACQRAALVICNGGSPATQQALAAGKPIVAVPTNLDQCLNMQAIARLGAGLVVRASRQFRREFRIAVEKLIGDESAAAAARGLSAALARYDSGKLLGEMITAAAARRESRQEMILRR
jgi:UDP:flavonoid glycosyltransferase YjiC (YdhE family)